MEKGAPERDSHMWEQLHILLLLTNWCPPSAALLSHPTGLPPSMFLKDPCSPASMFPKTCPQDSLL